MICPICNALSPLEVSCPNCGSAAEDEGRWSDWDGPYSPYEPILFAKGDALTITDETLCQHTVRCVACHTPFTIEINTWHI
ncbi:hypothetical protein [Cohnella sp. WQ 127256]|uniref:hypothetical protein n=1 Tax=Cohnella sp. WQ 127256 TaxID=2938790 RepID=UPI00211795BE|nr:hypothetical protein [Cohnella sp. WQ 127256]